MPQDALRNSFTNRTKVASRVLATDGTSLPVPVYVPGKGGGAGNGGFLLEPGEVVLLGKPFSKTAYANNVWDMQLFDGKIYLGHGNSSNDAPEANAGPIPIRYLLPSNNTFAVQNITYTGNTKTAVDEEQIDVYNVLNGSLFIPGHDPRGEGWELGNYYKISSGNSTWTKFRNIPNAIHNYNMSYFGGRYFAALGAQEGNGGIVKYSPDGITWTKLGEVFAQPRMYTSFQLGDRIYFCGTGTGIVNTNVELLSTDSALNVSNVLTDSMEFFQLPQSNTAFAYKMTRVTHFLGKVAFITGVLNNDHQHIPMWMVVMTDIGESDKVTLPFEEALPIDLLVRGDTLYVLAYYSKQGSTQYRNIVYKTKDLVKYEEVFNFNYNSFARSFEEYNGSFYFGIGCNMGYMPTETGHILKTKNAIV